MKYPLQWKPGGAVPPDLSMKIKLQNAPEPVVIAPLRGKTDCGACIKVTLADLSASGTLLTDTDNFKQIRLANETTDQVTSVSVIPVGLDIGPYTQSSTINDSDSTKICWAVTQVFGPTHPPPTIVPLGPNVADGISLTFDATVEGSYAGVTFIAFVRVPNLWQGVGLTSSACGQVNFNGPTLDPEVVLTAGLDFPFASWDQAAHVGHYGPEPDLEFTIELTATGYTGVPVIWNVSDQPGGLYQNIGYTTTDTTLTITFQQQSGAPNIDSCLIYWQDPVTSGISPTVLITQ